MAFFYSNLVTNSPVLATAWILVETPTILDGPSSPGAEAGQLALEVVLCQIRNPHGFPPPVNDQHWHLVGQVLKAADALPTTEIWF